MHVLLVGAAGHVGSIIRPTLEAEHDCRYLDVRPVPDAGERSIVGDVNDDATVRDALQGIDVVINLAMGTPEASAAPHTDRPIRRHMMDAAMTVNVLGLYRLLWHGLDLGVRRYVHTSTLSVYRGDGKPYPVDETRPPDAWAPYGLTKRLAEEICKAAAAESPEASILALRLMRPLSVAESLARPLTSDNGRMRYALRPNDLQRLYLAAIGFDRPGFHVAQAAGDLSNQDIPFQRARELIGWAPTGE